MPVLAFPLDFPPFLWISGLMASYILDRYTGRVFFFSSRNFPEPQAPERAMERNTQWHECQVEAMFEWNRCGSVDSSHLWISEVALAECASAERPVHMKCMATRRTALFSESSSGSYYTIGWSQQTQGWILEEPHEDIVSRTCGFKCICVVIRRPIDITVMRPHTASRSLL
ncbi:hypothetical protein B0H10DRAFT_1948806 [Mycena sp. CBHHK59/15]|nr:hypothetical protein B0H10DRAFT_1948806 [Mycena sp. CBHHK59/15]